MQVNAVYNCLLVQKLEVWMNDYYSIRWVNGVVRMLDQRLLPNEVVYRDFILCRDVATAIQDMVIRGAPALGVAAAFGLALVAYHSKATRSSELIDELKFATGELRKSRPTAMNLFVAIERINQLLEQADVVRIDQLKQMVVKEAMKIADDEVQMSLKIARNGQQFIPEQANLIHHCNTGALATVGIGTALAVIRVAHENGKKIHVYVDETRPRLQGARLTSWELKQLGIPHTVIVDGAAGYFMKKTRIDACLVGCDRIASNGDVANKIGTYQLALAAFAHQVPFYSVGPSTTIDLSIRSGEEITIEERSEQEVTHIGDTQITPDGVNVANPAFDITPAKYITAIITDNGIAYPPYELSLRNLMNG
jgi:methylthioribose-1-phosphate isomerase